MYFSRFILSGSGSARAEPNRNRTIRRAQNTYEIMLKFVCLHFVTKESCGFIVAMRYTLLVSRRFFSLRFLLFSFSLFFSMNSIIILFSVLLFIQTRLLSTCNGSSPCIREISVTATQWPPLLYSIANVTEVQLSGIFGVSPLALQSNSIVCSLLSFRFCECEGLLFDYKVGMSAFRVVGVRQRHFARAVCRQLSQLRRIDKQINSPEKPEDELRSESLKYGI